MPKERVGPQHRKLQSVSSMVEHRLYTATTWVRFPHRLPNNTTTNSVLKKETVDLAIEFGDGLIAIYEVTP